MTTDTKPLRQFAATYTCDHDNGVTGPLYYFAPVGRRPGPYRARRLVEAILDIADDGSLAGVELIDNMPPLPAGAQSSDAKDALLQEARGRIADIITIQDIATRTPAAARLSESEIAAYRALLSRIEALK